MKKNYIALAMGVFLCLNLMGITVNAVTAVKPTIKVTSVKLIKANLTMYPNKTETLKVNILPTNGTNKSIIWTSSNNKIVSVDKLGKIKTVGVGTAVVTATTLDGGKKATCIVRVIARPVVSSKPVYNGSAIKQKLYSLGFYSTGQNVALNKYGSKGTYESEYASFGVGSGSVDMQLAIRDSSVELNNKYRTIFNWILPTKGNVLYTITDVANVKSQTLNLDGRTVQIEVSNLGIYLTFGPTIKN